MAHWWRIKSQEITTQYALIEAVFPLTALFINPWLKY